MVQTVDVIAIFDKMIREPKPVRFKIYDSGHWKSVNVDRIFNTEWMRLDGKVQIVYSCASRSCNGQMINYKLKFIHQDIRWEMEMDGPILLGVHNRFTLQWESTNGNNPVLLTLCDVPRTDLHRFHFKI
jgi:hypothetical protein